jgi:hypothetical protein
MEIRKMKVVQYKEDAKNWIKSVKVKKLLMYLVRSFIAVIFATVILCPIELLVSGRYLSLYVEYSTPWIALNTCVSCYLFYSFREQKELNALSLLLLWSITYFTSISFVNEQMTDVVFEPVIDCYDFVDISFFIYGSGVIILGVYLLFFLDSLGGEEYK